MRCNLCEKYLSITKFTPLKISQLDYEEIEAMVADSFNGKLVCLMCDHRRAAKRRKALKPKKKYTIPMGASAGANVYITITDINKIL